MWRRYSRTPDQDYPEEKQTLFLRPLYLKPLLFYDHFTSNLSPRKRLSVNSPFARQWPHFALQFKGHFCSIYGVLFNEGFNCIVSPHKLLDWCPNTVVSRFGQAVRLTSVETSQVPLSWSTLTTIRFLFCALLYERSCFSATKTKHKDDRFRLLRILCHVFCFFWPQV